jgi:hypothetical protein
MIRIVRKIVLLMFNEGTIFFWVLRFRRPEKRYSYVSACIPL